MNLQKIITTALVTMLIAIAPTLKAQKNTIDKAFAQADKDIENNKPEDAEKVLKALAERNPRDGKVWDKLIETQMIVYNQKQQHDNLFSNLNFTITTTDSTGKKVPATDSLSQKLAEMLMKVKPSDTYLRHVINTCRVACCQTNQATSAAVIIRMYKVDNVSKSVNSDAIKQFNLAEKEFQKKNYSSAANYYKKALELDSTYYKASLYLGDVYYFTKHYDLAAEQFKKAVAVRPDLLEPRKYLADAFLQSNQYEAAYNVCVDALAVYPDFVMGYKLEDAAKAAGFKCDLHWRSRDVLPACAVLNVEKDDIVMPTLKKSPWVFYTQAFEKVKKYSDSKGILASNPVTTQKYLEVYLWEQMLEKSTDPNLDFARKMKEKGFLDCYVFVSCFHYDIYGQFKDFVAANPGKIKQYLELLKTI